MDVAELHRRSVDRFVEHVRATRPDQWDQPTPCTEWDVHALVNHVVGEDLWTPPLMAGVTIAEVGDRFNGDVLGPDPVATSERAAAEAIAAVSAPGALRRTVHLSFGDTPADEYVWQLFADHLIHGWDLARGIGADDRLDEDLVAACTEWAADNEDMLRAVGAIGPRPDLPSDADQQTVLLASFGRAR